MTNPDREEWQILDLFGNWVPAPSKAAAIGCVQDGTATALRRLASSDSGVKVRELHFIPASESSCYFVARSIFGVFWISEYPGSAKPFKLDTQLAITFHDTLDAAKAAAQADYEARIRSALIETPSASHQDAHQAAHAEKEKTNDTVQDGRSDHSTGMHPSRGRRLGEGESTLHLHDRENHQAEQQSEIAEPRPEVVWRNGPPPKPWCDEWFIAETIYRERVVLRSLPEEYTYDFKTADETYIKAASIKRWMQFPDSEYIAPPSDAGMREAYSALCLPRESQASDNLEGALYDIERLNAQGKPTDDICIRTLKRVLKQIVRAEQALTAPGATTKSDGGDRPNATTIAAIEELDRGGGEIGSGYGEYTPITVRGSTPDLSSTRSEVTVEECARKCADNLVQIIEVATKVAKRTGNTFVMDRQKVATMIAGHFAPLLDKFEIGEK